MAEDRSGDLRTGAPDVRVSAADLFAYTLRLADDALIYSQRMGGWIAAAPQLEEDVALVNIALDLLGQARSLLAYAGDLEGAGRSEDDLAYLRDEGQFVNAQIFELGNGDFAFTIARMLLTSAYQWELYARLSASYDATLAAVAAKAVKEVAYHRDHATQWTLRLGDGTAESHRRMAAGLEDLWPYVGELFETDELTDRLSPAGVGVDPAELAAPVLDHVESVLTEATLGETLASLPNQRSGFTGHTGGRNGIHTEQMGYLLAEMQYLHRAHPGATW
jgi:ring-1,2-phenylacetyl-CoA epoxidase subunit PaaC